MKDDRMKEDHAPLLERAFELDDVEASYRVTEIEGEVPSHLRGSYYVNGPARFQRDGLTYGHWLDGDGQVTALHFRDDGVDFVHRYVRGTKWTDEEEAGRPLYRAFGTSFEGDQLVRGVALASPLNVSVYPFAGKLLAFGEQGIPWELDPMTLETRGEHTFDGRLNVISPFSAHPCFDLRTGEMWNFGVSFAARQPLVNLFRFGPRGELVYRRRIPIEHPSSVHDFALGPRHAVIYVSPHLLDMAVMQEGGSVMDGFSWQPELGSRLVLADRESGEGLGSIEIEGKYCLHLIGCFEDGENLIVDVVELDQPVYDQYEVPQLFPEVRRSEPVRFVIDPKKLEVVEKTALDYRLMCDFPATDPRKWQGDYRDFWVLGISATEQEGRKFFDQVVHCDWTLGRPAGIWQAPPRHYLGGEPVFLPDPEDPRGGTVICQVLDAENRRGAFLLFDAFGVARGPVATLWLESPIRLGFHASFAPAS